MAKKKKSSKKKSAPVVEPLERSPFWALSGAIILIVVGLFLLLGGFGTGGSLPVGLFHGAYWAFGWAGYLTPVALVYWGVVKFKSEDRRISPSKFMGMLAVLVFVASWLHVMSAHKDSTALLKGGHGGNVGLWVGGSVLNALDSFPAGILFFVLSLLAICFAFGISPKVLANVFNIFKRREGEEGDTDLVALKAANGFQLNEGVPVVHHTAGERGATNLKNTASKLSAAEDHTALTTTSDPDWKFPGIDLLNQKQDKADAGNVNVNAQMIHDTFENFNIEVEMEGANIGPRVTQYTMQPPAGVKLSKIAALDRNLEYDLAAKSIRIEAPIPGKKAVGIEVPNVKPATVRISSVLSSEAWTSQQSPLAFVVGKDISGLPIVASLDKMPHILIAGQTNSGKSVMINTLLTSLIYKNSPSDLKLILVDPKHVELAFYNDIPHLLTEVINEPEKCISALKWAVAEMERRYRTLADEKTRNIVEYNTKMAEAGMPYIVIVIDELADLMMMAARDVEALIVRIAQKARAVGIHLVLATQSPRADIITGLIKANIPARIAFTVAGQLESRIVIDQNGAEKLLGMGDMLFSTPEMSKPKRVQGALITTEETQKVTDFLRMQRPPQYDDEVVSQPVVLNGKGGVVAEIDTGGDDDMFHDAVNVVIENRKASTSLLQRRLRIGYGRAARLIEQMEEQGIIGQADGSRPREVLVSSMSDVFGSSTQSDAVLDENFPDEA